MYCLIFGCCAYALLHCIHLALMVVCTYVLQTQICQLQVVRLRCWRPCEAEGRRLIIIHNLEPLPNPPSSIIGNPQPAEITTTWTCPPESVSLRDNAHAVDDSSPPAAVEPADKDELEVIAVEAADEDEAETDRAPVYLLT